MMIPVSTVVRRTREVYASIDPQLEKQARELGATCRRGCAACCHQLVGCTFAEALTVAEWLIKNSQILPGVSISWTYTLEMWDDKTYCPFILTLGLPEGQEECRVYEARPLACRFHYALSDPKECSPGGSPRLVIETEEAMAMARQPADFAIHGNDDLLALYGPMPQFVAHAIRVLRGETEPQVLELENWRRKMVAEMGRRRQG